MFLKLGRAWRSTKPCGIRSGAVRASQLLRLLGHSRQDLRGGRKRFLESLQTLLGGSEKPGGQVAASTRHCTHHLRSTHTRLAYARTLGRSSDCQSGAGSGTHADLMTFPRTRLDCDRTVAASQPAALVVAIFVAISLRAGTQPAAFSHNFTANL